jgi:hypothetical protein
MISGRKRPVSDGFRPVFRCFPGVSGVPYAYYTGLSEPKHAKKLPKKHQKTTKNPDFGPKILVFFVSNVFSQCFRVIFSHFWGFFMHFDLTFSRVSHLHVLSCFFF